MNFLYVGLHAPARSLGALADFYGVLLGGSQIEQSGTLVAVRIGQTRLEFLPSAKDPFYHFALLAPGNRFGELLEWVSRRTELLPGQDSGDVVFDFTDWEAQACYFHDPAGNIVEVIAYRGIGESKAQGSFAAEELIGFSELGLVGDTVAMAGLLRRQIGLEVWDGTVEFEGQLAFVGEVAKTLILCPVGRPWLPTGRPAEAHPADVVLSGSPDGEALLDAARYRIRRREAAELDAV